MVCGGVVNTAHLQKQLRGNSPIEQSGTANHNFKEQHEVITAKP
jgi:hypothetical protein